MGRSAFQKPGLKARPEPDREIGGLEGRTSPAAPAMSSLSIYLLGFLILVVGVTMGLHLAGVPTAWIGVVGVVMLGVGVLSAVSKTRRRDASPME